jgi:hypothetical protein
MTTAEILGSIVHRVGDSVESFGDQLESAFRSLSGNVIRKTMEIGSSTTKLLFDGSNDEIATVSIVGIRSDQTGVLELVYDTANTYGTTYQTLEVLGSGVAGKYGPALIIPNSRAYAGYTSPFSAGTLVAADKIRFKNLSATETCRIEILYGA